VSYSLSLACGCSIYVSCDPRTGLAHTRVVERRDARCRNRRHEVGSRLWLWELLPTEHRVEVVWAEAEEPWA
jgi:hypothetical protein